MEKAEFIEGLVSELKPLKRLWSPERRALVALIVALPFLLCVMWFLQPFRVTSFDSFLRYPRFGLEILFGYLSAALGIWLSFSLGVPGATYSKQIFIFFSLCLFSWLGLFAYSYFDPALPLTMVAKRESCFYETLSFGLLFTLVLVPFLRRNVFEGRLLPGALSAGACAALPAVSMQFSCMYDPSHALSHHMLPVGILLLVAAILIPPFLKRL